MRRLLAFLLLLSLAGCGGGARLGEEWTTVSEANFPLSFTAPGLEASQSSFLRSVRYTQGRPVVLSRGRWTAFTAAGFVESDLSVNQAGAGGFIVPLSAKDELQRLMSLTLEGRPARDPIPGQTRNDLGEIQYIHFGDAGGDCLVFYQSWRGERILSSLLGRYCRRGPEPLSALTRRAVLTGLAEK